MSGCDAYSQRLFGVQKLLVGRNAEMLRNAGHGKGLGVQKGKKGKKQRNVGVQKRKRCP